MYIWNPRLKLSTSLGKLDIFVHQPFMEMEQEGEVVKAQCSYSLFLYSTCLLFRSNYLHVHVSFVLC